MNKTLALSLIIMAGIINSLTACASGGCRLLKPVEFGEMTLTSPDIPLLDVRTPEEFAEGHIPGAINVDVMEGDFLQKAVAAIPDSKDVALYCRSGRRSADAAELLKGKGYNVTDLEGGILAWEEALLPVTANDTDIYFTPKGHKAVNIQALIHASVRIEFDGKEIEIDPVGQLGSRVTDYSKFPKADLILVTHEHHDHLDPAAIKLLSNSDTVVIANRNSADILGYGKVMANGDRLTEDGIEIEAVPAYNTSPDRLQFHPKGRDNGYILTLDGLRIYIAGDTEVIPEMEALKDIDIAFMPCNLPYTMTPEQLIKAAEIIKPKVLYPYHYGSTDLTPLIPALAPKGIYVRILPFDP